MLRRTLPGSDLQLSVVGLGCWALGKTWWGDDVTDERSIAAVQRALELGINWFDTAPLYGFGHADEILARALGPHIHQDDIYVATKVGIRAHGPDGHAQSDLSPEHLRSDTETSLKRLGIERIDLLQIHWPCQVGTALTISLDALQQLVTEGKVRYFGLCNYPADSVRFAMEYSAVHGHNFVSLQTPYSMIRREFEASLQVVCSHPPAQRTQPLGALVYETLCRGLLSGKYVRPPDFPTSDQRSWDERFRGALFLRNARFVAVLERAAARLQLPTSALAIAWVLSRPGVTAAIVGAKGAEQVEKNVRAAELLHRPKALAVIDRLVAMY